MAYAIRNVHTTGLATDDWTEWRYEVLRDGKLINEWYFDILGEPDLDDLREALARMKRIDLSFRCLDCEVHTGDANEYYMVHDEVWLLANPADDGMLCVSCLEARIGRVLTPSDFTDAPVNGAFGNKSDRLLERLGHGKPNEVVVS